MNVILSYLDNMFLNLPKTEEVLRAKSELASMMEDKYNELIAEGKKENEAVGIVISEFGDLSEIAKELGISELQEQNSYQDQTTRKVDRTEAEEYISLSQKTSKWIALGVFLCICCPIPLLICGAFDELLHPSDGQIVCLGLIPLFIIVAVAVAIFIYNGIKMERFEYLKREDIQIDSYLERNLREMDEQERPGATVKIIVGVVLCILSVIPLLVVGSVSDNEVWQVMTVNFLLVTVGVAVALFIIGGCKRECIKVLLQEGDFSRAGKKGNKVVSIIGGIYWPIATVIYLGWSFMTMDWWITWIVWPIAGVLFGAIAAICNAVSGASN